ncbi:hypothetical protein ACOMHN_052852 [Nucella lapillus]
MAHPRTEIMSCAGCFLLLTLVTVHHHLCFCVTNPCKTLAITNIQMVRDTEATLTIKSGKDASCSHKDEDTIEFIEIKTESEDILCRFRHNPKGQCNHKATGFCVCLKESHTYIVTGALWKRWTIDLKLAGQELFTYKVDELPQITNFTIVQINTTTTTPVLETTNPTNIPTNRGPPRAFKTPTVVATPTTLHSPASSTATTTTTSTTTTTTSASSTSSVAAGVTDTQEEPPAVIVVEVNSSVKISCSWLDGVFPTKAELTTRGRVIPNVTERTPDHFLPPGQRLRHVEYVISHVQCEDSGTVGCQLPRLGVNETNTMLVRCPLHFRERDKVWMVSLNRGSDVSVSFALYTWDTNITRCQLTQYSADNSLSTRVLLCHSVTVTGHVPNLTLTLTLDLTSVTSRMAGRWRLRIENWMGSAAVDLRVASPPEHGYGPTQTAKTPLYVIGSVSALSVIVLVVIVFLLCRLKTTLSGIRLSGQTRGQGHPSSHQRDQTAMLHLRYREPANNSLMISNTIYESSEKKDVTDALGYSEVVDGCVRETSDPACDVMLPSPSPAKSEPGPQSRVNLKVKGGDLYQGSGTTGMVDLSGYSKDFSAICCQELSGTQKTVYHRRLRRSAIPVMEDPSAGRVPQDATAQGQKKDRAQPHPESYGAERMTPKGKSGKAFLWLLMFITGGCFVAGETHPLCDGKSVAVAVTAAAHKGNGIIACPLTADVNQAKRTFLVKYFTNPAKYPDTPSKLPTTPKLLTSDKAGSDTTQDSQTVLIVIVIILSIMVMGFVCGIIYWRRERCVLRLTSSSPTLFRLPTCNKTSWMHPRSKLWHLIDYATTRKRDMQDLIVTKAMCGADCWTNHRLIVSRVKLRILSVRRPQGQNTAKRLNVSKLKSRKLHDSSPVIKTAGC